MIKLLIRRQLDAFERSTGYDMTYFRELLDTSLRAFRAFAGTRRMSTYREDAPLEAWFGAKIAAMVAQDCGPCVQLSATLALQSGLPAAQVRAMLTGDLAAMGDAAALGWRYARAVVARDPEADLLRAQIEQRWGRRALVSLAMQIAVAGTYPAMKYALGHGRACTRVRVGDADVVPALPQAA